MTSKMFLDVVGVITTLKLSILSTFRGGGGGAPGAPPPCQVGLRDIFGLLEWWGPAECIICQLIFLKCAF